MKFVLNKAEVENDNFKLEFSDDEEDMDCKSSPSSEDEDFIDDCSLDEVEEEETDPSFYRRLDNREDYSIFKNQYKNPVKASRKHEDEFYGEDNLSELFALEDREKVTFHSFNKYKEKTEKFKKSLRRFFDVENHFFMQLFMD